MPNFVDRMRSSRHYHIPTFADVPATEVHFADTFDRLGPLGAKSMSESPYNPIAAALANAVRDATGIRLHETPFTADRLHHAVLDLSTEIEGSPRARVRVGRARGYIGAGELPEQ
jgi:putative selenate reductase molybdopterin-binding subunit